MFKDYHKYLSTSLKVYTILLVITFIMKIVGLDYFGLDINNPVMIKLNNILINNKLLPIIKALIILSIQFYFYICIVCEKRKLYFVSFVGALINLISQIILMKFSKMNMLYYFISFSIMLIIPMIVSKKIMLKRQIKYILLITLYQAISLLIRNISIHYEYGNYIVDTIMNLDQLLFLAINYTIFFIKKEDSQCQVQTVGLFSQTKANLLKLLKRLQRNLHNFKALDKETKLTYIIYFILSLIWNTLTIIIILLFAKLNGTIIECLFILTSFWLSKRVFGKPFHLSSMKQCFIVSNLTYYILNRITTPLGISILIPIMLGVGLSYITSKLVKKTYKPLYKGMPNNLFEETILKVTDKDSLEYNICYDYYIVNKTALQVSNKYNYTYDSVKKIFKRVNDKIKGL